MIKILFMRYGMYHLLCMFSNRIPIFSLKTITHIKSIFRQHNNVNLRRANVGKLPWPNVNMLIGSTSCWSDTGSTCWCVGRSCYYSIRPTYETSAVHNGKQCEAYVGPTQRHFSVTVFFFIILSKCGPMCFAIQTYYCSATNVI